MVEDFCGSLNVGPSDSRKKVKRPVQSITEKKSRTRCERPESVVPHCINNIRN